jgi:hypothetical protein
MKQALLITLVLLGSCSSYLKNFEKYSGQSKDPKVNSNPTYCPIADTKNQYEFLTNHRPAINEYSKPIENIAKNSFLNFEETSVLWTLAQFYFRPLSTTPQSRIQFFYTVGDQTTYYDSGVHGEERNLFSTLNLFLSNSGSHKRISDLIAILERDFPRQIKVDSLLSQGLENFSLQIESDEGLKARFVKGGQILRENETYDRKIYSWFKGHQSNKKLQNRNQTGHLFEKNDGDTKLLCSFDMDIYENSLFPIRKDRPTYRHVFGISRNNKSFFAVTGQELIAENISKGGPASPAPSCLMKRDGKTILTISRHGRDPGQHLYHLYKYGLAKSQSVAEIDEYLKFPRYLLLFNPNRMLYESKRADSSQLEEFIKLDFPIYHIDNLGEVWAMAKFDATKSYFITDTRGAGVQSCQKE